MSVRRPREYGHTISTPVQRTKTPRCRPKSVPAIDVASLFRVLTTTTDEATAQTIAADLLKLEKNEMPSLPASIQHSSLHHKLQPSAIPLAQHRFDLALPHGRPKWSGSELSGHSLLVRYTLSQLVDRILRDLKPVTRSKGSALGGVVPGKALWSSTTIRYLTGSHMLPDGRRGSNLYWHFSQSVNEEASSTVKALTQMLTAQRPAVWIEFTLYSGSLKHVDLLLELIPQHASGDLLALRNGAFRLLQDCLTNLAPRQNSLYDLFSFISPATLLSMHGAPLVRHPAFHTRLSQLLGVDHQRLAAILERSSIFFDASDQVYYRLSSGVVQALDQEHRQECNALRLGMLDRILGALFPKVCEGNPKSFTGVPYSRSILALFTDAPRTSLSRPSSSSSIPPPSNWSQVSGHSGCRALVRYLMWHNTEHHATAICAVLSRYVYDTGHWLSDPSLTCPARMAQDVLCEVVEWLGGRLRAEGRLGSGSLLERTLGLVLKSAVRISGPSTSAGSGMGGGESGIEISVGLEGEMVLVARSGRGKSKGRRHMDSTEKAAIPPFSMTIAKENTPTLYSVRFQPLLLSLVHSVLQTRNYDGPGMRLLIGIIVDALQAGVDNEA